jgi:hypothetical protein
MIMRKAMTAILAASAASLGFATHATATTVPLTVREVTSVVKGQSDPLAMPQLGNGWIGYAAEYALTDAVVRSVKGVRDASGTCQFDSTVTASRERPAVLGRTRAAHLTECLIVREVGVPPADVVARYDAEQALDPGAGDATATLNEESPDSADTTDEVTPDVGAGSPPTPGVDGDASPGSVCAPGCRDAEVVSITGYYRTWYEDPLFIDVSTLRQEIFWSTEGVRGCVRSTSGSLSSSLFEQTGWVLNRSNRRAGYVCSRAYSSAYGKFTNEYFCDVVSEISPLPPGIHFIVAPARTFFNRAVARGYNSGNLTGNTRHSKKGGCSELLVFNDMARHY